MAGDRPDWSLHRESVIAASLPGQSPKASPSKTRDIVALLVSLEVATPTTPATKTCRRGPWSVGRVGLSVMVSGKIFPGFAIAALQLFDNSHGCQCERKTSGCPTAGGYSLASMRRPCSSCRPRVFTRKSEAKKRNWSRLRLRFCSKTNQRTPSVQGGVVSEPK